MQLTKLKLMFDHNIREGTKLKDLCIINRNGWTKRVPMMEAAFASLGTQSQNAQDVIRTNVHGIQYREFFARMFQRDVPF